MFRAIGWLLLFLISSTCEHPARGSDDCATVARTKVEAQDSHDSALEKCRVVAKRASCGVRNVGRGTFRAGKTLARTAFAPLRFIGDECARAEAARQQEASDLRRLAENNPEAYLAIMKGKQLQAETEALEAENRRQTCEQFGRNLGKVLGGL
jgi:hypothetical protein